MTDWMASHKISRDACTVHFPKEIPEGSKLGFDQTFDWFDWPLKIFKQFLKIVRKFRGVTRFP